MAELTNGSLTSQTRTLPKERLDDLIALLAADGYEVIGPTIDQSAIVYGPLRNAADLPIGWSDRQDAGFYRLEKRNDSSYFGYAVGPHSWKKYLFPPKLPLWHAERSADGLRIRPFADEPPRRAFLGVRSCELHALAIQDRVFLHRDGRFTDPHYAAARARLFLIAVECQHPGGTCFCASMGTGPSVQLDRISEGEASGPGDDGQRTPLPMAAPEANPAASPPSACDLVLTELDDCFIARAVTAAGEEILGRLSLDTATAEAMAEARRRVDLAVQQMGRTVDVRDVQRLLHNNLEHPRWDEVAARCLSCTNCTLVCPTCFCARVDDVASLDLQSAERTRSWDSCFNPEFARVHGGNFRPSIRGRYRQWLTHKFASWIDQFGVSGCVGCGRCITWCPVGIDVTEEITAIRGSDGDQQ